MPWDDASPCWGLDLLSLNKKKDTFRHLLLTAPMPDGCKDARDSVELLCKQVVEDDEPRDMEFQTLHALLVRAHLLGAFCSALLHRPCCPIALQQSRRQST